MEPFAELWVRMASKGREKEGIGRTLSVHLSNPWDGVGRHVLQCFAIVRGSKAPIEPYLPPVWIQ